MIPKKYNKFGTTVYEKGPYEENICFFKKYILFQKTYYILFQKTHILFQKTYILFQKTYILFLKTYVFWNVYILYLLGPQGELKPGFRSNASICSQTSPRIALVQ